MVYGHYVCMGGFATDVESIHDVATRATITPKAVLLLASEGNFLQIPRSQIDDKSKADILAKGLVCVQVIDFPY